VREDDPDFLGLVQDIRENGIINAIGVSVDGYIFDGHRRYAAAKHLDMERLTDLANFSRCCGFGCCAFECGFVFGVGCVTARRYGRTEVLLRPRGDVLR